MPIHYSRANKMEETASEAIEELNRVIEVAEFVREGLYKIRGEARRRPCRTIDMNALKAILDGAVFKRYTLSNEVGGYGSEANSKIADLREMLEGGM